MLRATLACSLLSFWFAVPAGASASDCHCSIAPDCAVLEASPSPLLPSAPDDLPTAWCESPDDPRCTPGSPIPSANGLGCGASQAAITSHATPPVGEPRGAVASEALARRLGPSSGVRARVERPPMR